MKLEPRRIEAFLSRPDPSLPTVLFYGPDRGLVGERAARLVAATVEDPDDPFAVTRLDAAAIEREPTRLAEEAQALPMLGGRKVVIVRDADDRIARAVRQLLELPDQAALVLLEADDLPTGSRLRQLVEKASNAVACPCYREEGPQLVRAIAAMLREHGLEASQDVVERLAAHLGADRALTRNEIDKLALYMGDRSDRRVTEEDIEAVIADAAPLGFDALLAALLDGRPAEVGRLCDRLLAEGEAPVALLRRAAAGMQRLLRLHAALEQGGDPRRAVDNARPPIFFRQRPVFERALARWQPRAVLAALDALQQAELICKSTGMPDRLVCRDCLVRLALSVRGDRRPAA